MKWGKRRCIKRRNEQLAMITEIDVDRVRDGSETSEES